MSKSFSSDNFRKGKLYGKLMTGVILLFFVLLLGVVNASAIECPPGFKWVRMSGVGCVQENCMEIENAKLSYTSSCICIDGYKGCYESVDYTNFDKSKCGPNCPYSRLVACVKPGEPCPDQKTPPNQEKPEAEEGEEKQPSRFIKPTLLEEFLRSLGYDESACPKEGDPPPGSVKFWSKVPGGGIKHSSVMLSNNRQIEMGHKPHIPGSSEYMSEILLDGETPKPLKGTYNLQKTLCPPPTYHFDNDYSEKMVGIDREYHNRSTHWNCHGFSARVVHNCVETGIRMKPITDFEWKGKTLILNGGEVWGDVISPTIQIPQGAVQFGSEYTIEVRNDNSTIIYLIKGKADYKGIGHSLSLSAGQMGVIDPTGVPSAPTTFNISEMDLWWTELNFFPETSQEQESLTFESNSNPSGSSVQIPLILNGIEDKIGNMDITLSYDSSVLEATEVTKGDLTTDSLFEYNILAGTILISLADAEGFSGNGSIAYVKFNVIGAADSTSPLQIAALTANRAEDYEILTIPTNDGVFRVECGLTVSVSDTTGAKDSTVDVPIILEGATDVGSMDMVFEVRP